MNVDFHVSQYATIVKELRQEVFCYTRLYNLYTKQRYHMAQLRILIEWINYSVLLSGCCCILGY